MKFKNMYYLTTTRKYQVSNIYILLNNNKKYQVSNYPRNKLSLKPNLKLRHLNYLRELF